MDKLKNSFSLFIGKTFRTWENNHKTFFYFLFNKIDFMIHGFLAAILIFMTELMNDSTVKILWSISHHLMTRLKGCLCFVYLLYTHIPKDKSLIQIRIYYLKIRVSSLNFFILWLSFCYSYSPSQSNGNYVMLHDWLVNTFSLTK